MTRGSWRRLAGACVALVLPGPLAGQAGTPLSASYGFVASLDDARAIWVNPAGLGATPEYSITGSVLTNRLATGSFRLSQWSFAFNSRGLGFGYQRDRFPDDPLTAANDPRSTGAYRLGFGVPFGSGALGTSVSLYRDVVGTEFAVDVGVRVPLGRRLAIGAVAANLGRPVLSSGKAPITGTVGFAWFALPQVLEIAAEARVAEGLGAGSTFQSRAGFHLSPGPAAPFSLMAVVDLDDRPAVTTLLVGITIGAADRAGVTARTVRTGSALTLADLGVFGVARRGPARPHP